MSEEAMRNMDSPAMTAAMMPVNERPGEDEGQAKSDAECLKMAEVIKNDKARFDAACRIMAQESEIMQKAMMQSMFHSMQTNNPQGGMSL